MASASHLYSRKGKVQKDLEDDAAYIGELVESVRGTGQALLR